MDIKVVQTAQEAVHQMTCISRQKEEIEQSGEVL
jgi:hypothetical protein